MKETKLTTQEKKILALIRKGLLNKEIAAQLGISLRTVETHIKNMHIKTKTNNKVELAAIDESKY